MPVPSHPPSRRERRLRDAAIRVVGIPVLGLGIPRLTGILDGLSPRDGLYWAGTGWFVLLSAILWMGNRWILFRLRDRLDWAARPLARLLSIIGATAAYTLIVASAMLLAWFAVDHRAGLDGRGLAVNLAWIVPAVLVVTHLYETLFLIGDRLEDRLDVERAERARLQAELALLKSRLTPHFLFNSLHTLSVLIDESPRSARQFTRHLATVCRYLLAQSHRELVPLTQELDHFQAYLQLARLRFPDSLVVDLRGFDSAGLLQIPPASLQLLLENALRHNALSAEDPLRIDVELAGDRIRFSHRGSAGTPDDAAAAGEDLCRLSDRCRGAAGAPLAIERTAGRFRVTLPLTRPER